MNETLQTIARRHSTRKFEAKPISDEVVKTILNAANQAPSAHNQQSWRFIVLRGEKKNGLATLIADNAVKFPKASAVLLRMAARTIISAPAVIAIANTGELIEHGQELFQIENTLSQDFFRTMEIQSSSAAVQNLLLAATSLGVSSVWLGIMYLIKKEVLEYLGEPQGEFMAIVPIGYSEKEALGPTKRPLDVLVKFEG
jgi:nitroreductase